jgi:hypothetical protein
VLLEKTAANEAQRHFVRDIRHILSQCIPQDFKAASRASDSISNICDDVEEVHDLLPMTGVRTRQIR